MTENLFLWLSDRNYYNLIIVTIQSFFLIIKSQEFSSTSRLEDHLVVIEFIHLIDPIVRTNSQVTKYKTIMYSIVFHPIAG